MKPIATLSLVLLASACASASKPGAMVAPVTEAAIIAESSPLREAVAIGEVGGGKETNPLWTSEVSSDAFREALSQSLAAHAMLAVEGETYRLDATLEELKQPFAGFNMTVTARVAYRLVDVATGAEVFAETVETAHTATMNDAFAGVKRLQLANEGAVKANIAQAIRLMVERLPAAPALSGPASSEAASPQS